MALGLSEKEGSGVPALRHRLSFEMSEIEFNALIGKFIERETEGTGDVPAEVLFEALPGFLARACKAIITPE